MPGDPLLFKLPRQVDHRHQNRKQRSDQHQPELVVADMEIDDAAHEGREGEEDERGLQMWRRPLTPGEPADKAAGQHEDRTRQAAERRTDSGHAGYEQRRDQPAGYGREADAWR